MVMPPRDNEGYLRNAADWHPAIARLMARESGMDLTQEQEELIACARRFYEEFGLSPAMRPLVKYVAKELGPDKGNSLYLMKMFPDASAKTICKLAGLPKPANCL